MSSLSFALFLLALGGAAAQAEPAPRPPNRSLEAARRLSAELRYEEAAVEYESYVGDASEPAPERAKAYLELGFLHFVLGHRELAWDRALKGFELDPEVKPSPGAPAKQVEFAEGVRSEFAARVSLEVLPPADPSHPERIQVRLLDPKQKSRSVLLRHALAPSGPFYGAPMQCAQAVCLGEIPVPRETEAFTAWYYPEAIDSDGNTLVTRGPSSRSPLRVSLVNKPEWYRSPWVWGGASAAVVAVAMVVWASFALR